MLHGLAVWEQGIQAWKRFLFFLVDWVHAYDVFGMTVMIFNLHSYASNAKCRTSCLYHAQLLSSGSLITSGLDDGHILFYLVEACLAEHGCVAALLLPLSYTCNNFSPTALVVIVPANPFFSRTLATIVITREKLVNNSVVPTAAEMRKELARLVEKGT